MCVCVCMCVCVRVCMRVCVRVRVCVRRLYVHVRVRVSSPDPTIRLCRTMSNQAAECKAAAERARHMRSQLSPMPPVAGGTSPIAGPRSPGATALQGSGAWPAQAVTQLFVSNLPKAYSKGELCADFAGFGTIAEVGARVVSREPQDSVRAWSAVLRLSSVVLDPSPSTPTPPAVFPSSRMSPGAPAPSRLLPASPPTRHRPSAL